MKLPFFEIFVFSPSFFVGRISLWMKDWRLTVIKGHMKRMMMTGESWDETVHFLFWEWQPPRLVLWIMNTLVGCGYYYPRKNIFLSCVFPVCSFIHSFITYQREKCCWQEHPCLLVGSLMPSLILISTWKGCVCVQLQLSFLGNDTVLSHHSYILDAMKESSFYKLSFLVVIIVPLFLHRLASTEKWKA